jgi:hypothetical protein
MAEQVFTVPLTNVPQKFSIVLGGRQLVLVNKWNEDSGWLLDIYDGQANKPLIMAVPMIVGADLLSQYEYVGIPGSLIVYTDGNQFSDPTLSNLGGESNLYYLVNVV